MRTVKSEVHRSLTVRQKKSKLWPKEHKWINSHVEGKSQTATSLLDVILLMNEQKPPTMSVLWLPATSPPRL